MSRPNGPLAERWGGIDAARLLPLLDGLRDRVVARPAGEREAWPQPDRATRHAVEAFAAPGTPWPQPLVSTYSRYFRDGDRATYEEQVGDRQRRLTASVLLAAWTAEERWIDEVADGVGLLVEQSSWSWAAHDDTFAVNGWVVPRADRPFLDLGAAEVASQLAWTDHVLGAGLDARAPGLRERMRLEFLERCVRPFLDRRDWHWLGLDGDVHNWNPWIHGGLIAGACFLIDEPDLRAEVVATSLTGIDRYLAAQHADGAIDEGFGYWWNGAGRALEALDLVAQATGGALSAADVPVVRALVGYPHRMHLGGDHVVNHGDGPARIRGVLPWHVLHRWGRLVGDDRAVAYAAANRSGAVADPFLGLGRVLGALPDEAWRSAAGASPLPRSSWFPSVQVLVAREAEGNARGLAVAAKGGTNGEHHNHLDVGSVIVAVDGAPLVVDAGKPRYTAQTFGPDRYAIRTMRTEWHSAPAPFGLEQSLGADAAAFVLDRSDDGVALELAAAYPLEAGDSWRREVRLDRARHHVVVEDAWHLTQRGDAPVAVRFLLAGEVEVGEGRATVLPRKGRGLRLTWTDAAAALDAWRLEDDELEAVWGASLTRLTLTMPPAATREGRCRVTATTLERP